MLDDDEHHVYLHGQPTYTGDTVVRCFAGSHNGLLFRIINSDEYRWAFYNDTTTYHITAQVSFGGYSKVEPLGKTTMQRNRATTTFDFEVTVAPGATELFMEGEPDGFEIHFVAQRFSRKMGNVLTPVVIQAPTPPPLVNDGFMGSSDEDDEGMLSRRRRSTDCLYSPVDA